MEANEEENPSPIFKPRNSLSRSPPPKGLRDAPKEAAPATDSEVDNTQGDEGQFKPTPGAAFTFAGSQQSTFEGLFSQSGSNMKKRKLDIGRQSPGEATIDIVGTIRRETKQRVDRLITYIHNPRKVGKDAAAVISPAVRDLESHINILLSEYHKIQTKVEMLTQEVEYARSQAVNPQTLRDAIADALKEVNTNPQPPEPPKRPTFSQILNIAPATPKKPPSTIFIAPTEKSKEKFPTLEALKLGIKENFTPANEGVKIRGMTQTAKGLVIKTQTKEEAKKVMQSEGIKRLGAQVRLEEKRLPRMIVYDVPSDIEVTKISELFWAVNAQNLDKSKEIFKPIFRTGPRGKECVHWVIEVSPAIREEIMMEGRVFLDWASCNARDWISVTRCNKCQGFGHVEKFCSAKVCNCAFCGERGHAIGECPTQKSSGQPKCINCARTNIKANHPATNKDCPSYKRALDRLVARTMYTDDG